MLTHLVTGPFLSPSRRLAWIVLWLVTVPCTAWAQHSGSSQNVMVLVNLDSPESLAVANRYVQLRQIPPSHVLYLRDIRGSKKDNLESIQSGNFREDILAPLNEALQQRGLESQIDFIAFSAGFPTRVVVQKEEERYLEVHAIEKYDIHFHAPFMSLTSAMLFSRDLFAPQPRFLDSHSNWYARPGEPESRAFSCETWYTPSGDQGDETSGQRYRLAMALAVVRPEASTLENALANLERSATADGSLPQGVFYFARNKDPRSLTRQGQFAGAAAALQDLGFEVQVAGDPLPSKQKIIGAVLGSAKADWPQSGSRFLPGAFCDNFTSYGAWWTKSQTTLDHFLDQGAAGAVGTVYEPYTIPTKIPTAWAQVHYARGCTLAESIFQTVLSPYQLLVAGDPLCRPFARLPELEITGLEDRSVVQSDLKLATRVLGKVAVGRVDVYLDGVFDRQIEPGATWDQALSDLSPGFHELAVVAVTDDAVAASQTCRREFFVRDPQRPAPDLRLALESEEAILGQPIRVDCAFPEGIQVRLMHNSRLLAEFQSNGQPITVDSGQLGAGEVRLYAEADIDGQRVRGVPRRLNLKQD